MHVATSFGASITLLYASRFSFSDFSAVAFWNPVIDYEHTFVYPRTEWTKRYFDHKNVEEFAGRAAFPMSNDIIVGPRMAMELLLLRPQDTVWPHDVPLLIIHGDRDTCVPYEDSFHFWERNQNGVRLLTLEGMDHGFGARLSEAFEATLAFFSG
jgi:pimeloyl-ACP methyl ester carboxylesterase